MNTDSMTDFIKYVDKQILPSVEDIQNLPDASRKHVQRLVYTNLVDRFDTMLDVALLQNCRCKHLLSQATGNMTQSITEADLVKLLIHSGSIQDALDEKLKMSLRNTVLRARHSRKLATLIAAFDGPVNVSTLPRVNISTGAILDKIKPQHKTVPYSICGYADWVYARRNSLVHGGGTTRFLDNDRKQIEKLYRCKIAKSHKVKLASTTVSSSFYKNLVALLEEWAA